MKSFLGGMLGGLVSLLLLAGLASLSWYYSFEDIDAEFSELDEYDYEWVDQRLRDIMLKVESYHGIFGFYPESLDLALGSTDSYDSLTEECECGDSSDFFYKLSPNGSSYVLFSKGVDCQPFTKDDYHPKISDLERPILGITSNFNEVAAVDAKVCNDT